MDDENKQEQFLDEVFGGKKPKIKNHSMDSFEKVWKPITPEQETELQRQSDEVFRSLTLDEKFAIGDYTQELYRPINQYLYGNYSLNEEYEKIITFIDAAISKFILQYDLFVVYSGTSEKHYLDWECGNIKTLKAYLSTSINKFVAQMYFNNIRMQCKSPLLVTIKLPKGTPCLYIGTNTEYSTVEYELLLGRNLKYNILEKNNDKMLVEVIL